MKYVVTQKQIDGLRETILNYLDNNLTPYDGLENHQNDYARRNVKSRWRNISLHFVELGNGIESFGDEPHMWYSDCDNPNLSEPLPKGQCPLVAIDSSKYEALDAFFGEIWKPVFLEWFKNHTGLKIKHVDVQDW
jgi:hypothetical protein